MCLCPLEPEQLHSSTLKLPHSPAKLDLRSPQTYAFEGCTGPAAGHSIVNIY